MENVMYELEKSRINAVKRANSDIIGVLYHDNDLAESFIYENDHTPEGRERRAHDAQISAALKKSIADQEVADKLIDEIFGLCSDWELAGFRRGFSLATKLMIQGISGNESI